MSAKETLVLPEPPPATRLPPEMRESRTRYRFDLDDGRSFTLALDRGRLSLEEGGDPEADCVLHCTAEEFQGIVAGDRNLLTAMMRGDIRVAGNLEWARRLYRYLHLTGHGGGNS
jgi:putative sterol carrier protein